MKKVMVSVILSLLLISATVCAGDFTHTVGFAFDSALTESHDFTNSGSTLEFDVAPGISVMYEGLTSFTRNVDFGFGLEFMLPRELDESGTDAAFNFAPLYVTAVFHTDRYNDYVPFFSIQAGYNLLYDGNDDYKGGSDLTGGLYYGAGVGVIFSQMTRFEIRWSRYEGVYDTGFGDADVSNEELSIVLGFYF